MRRIPRIQVFIQMSVGIRSPPLANLLLMASLSVCLATVRAFCFDLSTSKRVISYSLRPTSRIGRLPQQP